MGHKIQRSVMPKRLGSVGAAMTTPMLLVLAASSAFAGERIAVDVPEPSGIDFDRDGGRVFVVDDGGELWVFDEDYNELDVFDLGGDLEGVDYLPRHDQLLVAVEGEESLLLVDPDTGEVLSSQDIPRTFQGETVMAAGDADPNRHLGSRSQLGLRLRSYQRGAFPVMRVRQVCAARRTPSSGSSSSAVT